MFSVCGALIVRARALNARLDEALIGSKQCAGSALAAI